LRNTTLSWQSWIQQGVLFLVDTWGGSPFNAASRIVVDKEHYEVIAGVNIPMLVET
jgi:PTS system mannose-specific IIB component